MMANYGARAVRSLPPGPRLLAMGATRPASKCADPTARYWSSTPAPGFGVLARRSRPSAELMCCLPTYTWIIFRVWAFSDLWMNRDGKFTSGDHRLQR